MTGFLALAVLLSLVAAGAVLWPLLRDAGDRAAIPAVLAALGLPAFVVFGYLAASNHDWNGGALPESPLAGADGAAGNAPLEEVVAGLEERLRGEPGDQAGWVLLGSSYTALGRPDDALRAYGEAERLSSGSNLDARLGMAEARLLKDRSLLAGEVGDVIETVLGAAPANPKALWYGGLVALSRGQPEVAEQRWSALLALSPPERIRGIVEAELAGLRGGGAAATPQPATEPVGVGLDVGVRLGTTGSAGVRPGAPLFVFVRDSSGGPPLAVVRRLATDLPLQLRITDADVMMPGRSLAGVRKARVTARIANGGDPVAKPGDVYGEADWIPGQPGPVELVIDRTVGAAGS